MCRSLNVLKTCFPKSASYCVSVVSVWKLLFLTKSQQFGFFSSVFTYCTGLKVLMSWFSWEITPFLQYSFVISQCKPARICLLTFTGASQRQWKVLKLRNLKDSTSSNTHTGCPGFSKHHFNDACVYSWHAWSIRSFICIRWEGLSNSDFSQRHRFQNELVYVGLSIRPIVMHLRAVCQPLTYKMSHIPSTFAFSIVFLGMPGRHLT